MKHLTREQRYTIFVMKEKGKSNTEIAQYIGVHKSTIGRELKRNSDARNQQYRYELAQRKYEKRKAEKPHHTVLTKEIKLLIEEKLSKDKWQPEQISNRLKKEGVHMVSTVTIYRYICQDKKLGGSLYKHLRRKKPYRKLKGLYSDNRGVIKDRVDISLRPEIVDKKERFGDLEIDTIIGANHKGALLTINDRCTGHVWIKKLTGKDAEELASKANDKLSPFAKHIHTITGDNGKEFAEHKKIAKELNIIFYFAKPYHSWQRGANENTNGLIRQFFPKGTDFNNITDQQVQIVETLLNNRPRKRLDYLTPKEKLENLLFNKKVAFAA